MAAKRVWYLGAPDVEMAMIERVLTAAGETWHHAVNSGGARVSPAIAYRWDAPADATHLVECGRTAPPGTVRVDHHNPGDPGYGIGPAGYWAASSIGQVCAILGITVVWHDGGGAFRHAIDAIEDGGALAEWACRLDPAALVYTAAADHCLAAAYVGRCPGVGPARLADYRRRLRAEWLAMGTDNMLRREYAATFGWLSPEEIDEGAGCGDDREAGAAGRWAVILDAAYRYTEQCLWSAPRIPLGGVDVIDLRGSGTLPELPEMLAYTGQAAIYRMAPRQDAQDARIKVGIIGCGEGSVPGTAPVEAFLGGWAASEGLVDIYPAHDGTPSGIRRAAARGYAGGYMPAGPQ